MAVQPCPVVEPLAAAPVVNGWVLVEHPGPWGREPHAADPLIPAWVRAIVTARKMRVNLIRRHGGRRPAEADQCFLASAGPRPFVEQVHREDLYRHLPEVLDALATGHPSGLGMITAEPLFLVCTNGRRNAACARSGRPVANAVAAIAGPRTWETSHVGGCRFAVNLICLPAGVYYGGVRPDDVPTLLDAMREQRIALPWYRGRVGIDTAAQTAEGALRRATGLDGLDAVRPGCSLPDGRDGLLRVELDSVQGRYRVTVRPHPADLTRYEVVDLVRLSTRAEQS